MMHIYTGFAYLYRGLKEVVTHENNDVNRWSDSERVWVDRNQGVLQPYRGTTVPCFMNNAMPPDTAQVAGML